MVCWFSSLGFAKRQVPDEGIAQHLDVLARACGGFLSFAFEVLSAARTPKRADRELVYCFGESVKSGKKACSFVFCLHQGESPCLAGL